MITWRYFLHCHVCSALLRSLLWVFASDAAWHVVYLLVENERAPFSGRWIDVEDSINSYCTTPHFMCHSKLSIGLSCVPSQYAPPTRVCATVPPRWPLRHWSESLKSLLHMAFKERWHRVCDRSWYWDWQPWKIKSRLAVRKVKMRLALGFCGQFAKTTFSSLSVRRLEVGHHIEVKGSVSALRRTLCSLQMLWFVSGGAFHVLWA